MAEQKIILSFYQEPSEAAEALRKLKRGRFHRLASIHKTADGRLDVYNIRSSGKWSRLGLFFGAAVGLFLGGVVRFYASSLNVSFDWMDLALLAIMGALAGFLGIRWLGFGINEKILSQYRPWIALNETLLIIQTKQQRLDRALDLLRSDDGNAFIFVVRPFRPLDDDSKDTIPRRESLTAERLNLQAARLAARHQAIPVFARGRRLLQRLESSEKVLKTVFQGLNEAVRLKQSVSLSAEWLLDNSYVIETQTGHVRRNLTRGFYKVLPILTSGPNAGDPRIYGIALELVAHSDGLVDERNITDFLRAYQRISPLTVGELWAMPLMLRLSLIESLRQLSVQLYQRQYERERADFWANRLIVAARRDPDQMLVLLAEMARLHGAPSHHFAMQLIRQLSEEESALGPAQGWLERKLGAPIADVVQQEQNRRTAKQVSISNIITSLRRLSRTDWRKLFEEVSLVEEILRTEPAGIYAQMDFDTRDAYRHAVEEMARGAGRSEISVAQQAVSQVRSAFSEDWRGNSEDIPPHYHVGYYLIGDGRPALDSQLGCRVVFSQRLLRWTRRHPTSVYLGSIVWFTSLYLALPLAAAFWAGAPVRLVLVFSLLALLPASELAVQVLNYLVTLVLPAKALPKMSFEYGIPDEFRTLVVVPMMLLSPGAIETEVNRLEVRYLANSDDNIQFALLSDFSDAPEPHMPEDDNLLSIAVAGIEDLNQRYGARFFLFHRPRRWCQSEQCWMGWERKRGKLEELNQFLNGEPTRSGDPIHAGNREALHEIRFVITLDADTQLPHDAARRLIETLAHPLNRPHLADDGQTVKDGYTIIQPRVSASLSSATATRFARLFSDPAGVDPYTHAVSDVYQDLFGEGSYVGKGIYDVKMFHRVLSGRFSESKLLSHDLLEGAYVRAGLASDIELFDIFPANYLVYSSRQHRWIRGDWQIADWILPAIRGVERSRQGVTTKQIAVQRNPLSVLNRWKIFDNLRRSLVPISALLLIWASWLLYPASSPVWIAFVILMIFASWIIQLFDKNRVAVNWLLEEPRRAPITWRELVRPLATGAVRSLSSIALLPHQTQLSLDAVGRVWFRRLISHRRMLEWETAQMAHTRARHRQRGFLWQIGWTGLAAAAISAVALGFDSHVWNVAIPLLILWLASPLVVKWLDTEQRPALALALEQSDRDLVRRFARQTWRYFDEFTGPQTHWLPPDNYQESLRVEIAQRTSPTNIGLWLLSLLAAHDLRYITIDAVFERASATLETMENLERFEGHLLNWYDIRTLQPLVPRYVSTVDSGNLVASLWTLEQACYELLEEPLLGPEVLRGLSDTLNIARDQIAHQLPSSGFPVLGSAFQVSGSGSRVSRSGSWNSGSSFPISGFGSQVSGSNTESAAQARWKSASGNAEPGSPNSEIEVGNPKPLADAESETRGSETAAPTSDPETRNSKLETLLSTLSEIFSSPPSGLDEIIRRLRSASEPARQLREILTKEPARPELSLGDGPERQVLPPDPFYWAEQLEKEVTAWNTVIDRYLSWVEILTSQPDDVLLPISQEAPKWRMEALEAKVSLAAVAAHEIPGLSSLMRLRIGGTRRKLSQEILSWLDELSRNTARAERFAAQKQAEVESMIGRFRILADGINMRFLYDSERKLFTVGYSASEHRPDTSYYDLLASEARLTSFAAIARGDVPVEHWWTLGRLFGTTNGQPTLLSWGGTMFEYLMPMLLNRSYEHSLLDLASKTAVKRQIEYARQLGIPWGISEAGFAGLDSSRIYQYRAFGVPGLGLKRGLEDDTVVAPYAAALALGIVPAQAVANLKSLAQTGLLGNYGFYEAIDYTQQRVPEGERGVIVHAYMAHHQGMSLIAFDNVLNGGIMQRRFHSDPRVRAAEPLLCERIPLIPPRLEGTAPEGPSRRLTPIALASTIDRSFTPDSLIPKVHLLSNGNYAVMVTSAGGGYSRWRDLDITRWRADTTRDSWGTFCYVRDLKLGVPCSTTHQPICRTSRHSTAITTAERVEFQRRDFDIDTVTEIVVSPEDDAEIRRITLTNHSDRRRDVELTSYAELALASHGADRSHPAFNKMFVHTEVIPERHILLASRRPRDPAEPPIWAAHVLATTTAGDEVQFETDRARFVGRGRTLENPAALEGDLSNSVGSVLDPIFSLRWRRSIEPGERVQISFVTMASDSRSGALALAEKYSDLRATERALEMAWTHAQLELRQLRIQAEDGRRFQQLASNLLYPNARLRPPAERLRQNTLGQERLWAYGISGDLPIILVTISDTEDIDLVREVLVAHNYLRVRGLKSDLVIINEEMSSYSQPLMEQLRKMIHAQAYFTGIDQPGGVFLRAADQIPEQDLALLMTTVRAVLIAARGTLAQQLGTPVEITKQPPPLVISQRIYEEPSPPLPFMELPYFNGLGGFTSDGREYAIYLGPEDLTPAPWINVIANPDFGTLVTESGPGFSWFGNSQSNRLTPWYNDPVSNPVSETVYIRDEDSGLFWTLTPLPIREMDAYRIRHGQGYTLFEHNSHAIEQELLVFVPLDENNGAPVRIQRVRLRNSSSHHRRLTVTSYVEWVLGTDREETQLQTSTNWDEESQSLLARNPFHAHFGNRVAFASCSPDASSFTGDRTEFLGRNGSPATPAALERRHLSGRSGAGLDPCAALQTTVEIDPGQEAEVIFLLGQSDRTAQARQLARDYRDSAHVDQAFQATRDRWDQLLEVIQVETPILATNFLLNRWLLYQTLSCRVWARSAFYQSSGAFGFRDQLQDVMSLVYASPGIARAQILRAAAHQFIEGDAQHWWHPPSDAGVRTRSSDDLLWLPYVTAHYVRTTGDLNILDAVVPFLEGRPLEEHEPEAYLTPRRSLEEASVLEHCRRAITKGLTSGPHGLPLMGGGDWNDGMNHVGTGGKGESVWLAWFLIEVLKEFAELVSLRGEEAEARNYRERAAHFARAVEAEAWDGEWYRRAYYDDGTPLGSKQSEEAKIDSLPQSWAVISGAADTQRAAQALQSVQQHLVRESERLVLLFTPPFEKSPENPGYIKGYPPGVRENGGQYTHGSLWVALAFARRGDGNQAVKLLQMMNPVEHARNPEETGRYKVEPYVVAADVYSLEGRVGQGGWTWYTGSSGWMYRIWLEDVLGFKLRGKLLRIDPSISSDWEGYTLHYRRGQGRYRIQVENPDRVCRGVTSVQLDGQTLASREIELSESPGEHTILVRLGKPNIG
ncbi:MAG TPA: glucoamylase family protein [Acidobacteriota bacterium]